LGVFVSGKEFLLVLYFFPISSLLLTRAGFGVSYILMFIQ